MDANTYVGSGNSPKTMTFILRTHRPGDIGYIASRHGFLYNQELSWPIKFEALVARICADFADGHDASCERLWIAEDTATHSFQGCIMLVRDKELPKTAKLRILLVEPSARETGLGTKLVKECIDFARQAKYQKVVLWTQSILVGARRLYQAAGFRLVGTEEHNAVGIPLTGEFWELEL